MRIRGSQQEGGRAAGIVEAVTQRRAANLLDRRRWKRVAPDAQNRMRQMNRRAGAVERRGVGQRPHQQLLGGARTDRRAITVRLVGGIRAQEVLRAAIGRGVVVGGRDGRPQREAGVPVVEALRADLGEADRAVVSGQRSLGEGVKLRAVELGPEERVFIGCDVETIGVRPDVGIVADARIRVVRGDDVRAGRAVMIRRPHGAVILIRNPVDRPRAQRAGRLADGDVEVV